LGWPCCGKEIFSPKRRRFRHHVVIVNRAFVHDRFGEENPIGPAVRFSDYETGPIASRSLFKIIGVVADARYRRTVSRPGPKSIYGHHGRALRRGHHGQNLGQSAAILQQLRTEIPRRSQCCHRRSRNHCRLVFEHYYYARPRFPLITLCTSPQSLSFCRAGRLSGHLTTVPHRPAKSASHGHWGAPSQARREYSCETKHAAYLFFFFFIGRHRHRLFASYFLTRLSPANLGIVRNRSFTSRRAYPSCSSLAF